MNRAIPAAAPTPKYRPAFFVQKLDGDYEITQYEMEPYGKENKNGERNHRLIQKKVTAPCGWLVTFPKSRSDHAHSIHIATIEEMQKFGYDRTEVPLVDEDGEAVGSVPNMIRRKEKTVNA